MKQARLWPQLPPEGKAAWCFYPMSKRRWVGANWFTLPYEERKELMYEHGASGRTFAGRILQVVTGSTGVDDFEWGVTLFGVHPDDLKEVVYTMRYDKASAHYGEFGVFYTGLVGHARRGPRPGGDGLTVAVEVRAPPTTTGRRSGRSGTRSSRRATPTCGIRTPGARRPARLDAPAAGRGADRRGRRRRSSAPSRSGPTSPAAGAHVANFSAMVAPDRSGRGIGRALAARPPSTGPGPPGTAPCSSTRWSPPTSGPSRCGSDLGFRIVGTVPGAFRHPTEGDVDLHVMHRGL